VGTSDPRIHPRDPYTPAAVAACEKALLTLLTKIGPWGSKLILIGGLAPRYLVGTAPTGITEHVGTTDLDIVVGISLATEEEEAYRTLQQNLKDARFSPARNAETGQEETFRWHREVEGVNVLLEFFCPVGDGEAGRLLRNPGGVGSKISAIRTRGAELAGTDFITVTLSGELLEHGGIQENTPVRVANLLPFIVLKAFALDERDKAKDSYDLVWTIAGYGEGPHSAVQAMAASPIIRHPDVAAAIVVLRQHFNTSDHRGPAQYANFEMRGNDQESRARLRRYAHGTITEFLRHWDDMGMPG
jgi:hypothetical protein